MAAQCVQARWQGRLKIRLHPCTLPTIRARRRLRSGTLPSLGWGAAFNELLTGQLQTQQRRQPRRPSYEFQSYTGDVTLNEGLAFLNSIGDRAFLHFSGTLTISGSFPLLSSIGEYAFHHAGNYNAKIEIGCNYTSVARLVISSRAFNEFKGKYTVCCPDGSTGLTRELYEAGVAAGESVNYANVTCIPYGEFWGYTGDLMLDEGLAFLTSIDDYAFIDFKGTLTISGSFPLLSSTGVSAFQSAGNAESKIELVDGLVPNLTSIESHAFYSFRGTLTIRGSFPLLSSIGYAAFNNAGHGDSKIELVDGLVSSLTSIENHAFQSFAGILAISGRFPLLSSIGASAFESAGNANSTVELIAGLVPNLTSIEGKAFFYFGGTLAISGRFPLLSSIGDSAFESAGNANSTIELVDGLVPKLTSIERDSFQSFAGTLTISGSFPLLSSIAINAFNRAGNARSKIELGDGLPKLTSISRKSFFAFPGTLMISGTFPLLSIIGKYAFTNAGDANSIIELVAGLPKLISIEPLAFNSFKGTLTIRGSFPVLSNIGSNAFFEAGNAVSKIELADGLPELTIIHSAVFSFFKGTLIISGPFPLLSSIEASAFKGAGNTNSTIELVGELLPKLATVARDAFVCMKGTLNFSGTFPLFPNMTDVARNEGHTDQCTAGTSTASTTPQDTSDNAAMPPKGRSNGIVGVALGAIGGVLALAVGAVAWFRRRTLPFCSSANNPFKNRHASKLERELCAATNERAQLTFLSKYSRQLYSSVQSADEYATLVGALELPRAKLKIVRQLGSGNYGIVMLATLKAPPSNSGSTASSSGASSIEVAVKSQLQAEPNATVDEALLVEALVLHSLKHPHILGLVGVCTTSLPFLVATELMANGDLKSYLRACRPSQPKPKAKLTLYDVSLILERIALALAHLERLSIIHRDVACRNVLVGTAPTDVKLGDLGAARSVFREAEREYTATSDHMPVRWMAPESLLQASFTNKSDVWSFGVFCWEVTTHGKTPYGVFGGVKGIAGHLKSGGRLEASVFTPPGLYKQLLLCWSEDPKRRPRFADLVHILGAIRGAVAVAPEATMILDANNEVVQQGRDRSYTTDSTSSRSVERRPDAGSVGDRGGAMQTVLNPTFGGNGTANPPPPHPSVPQTADGYVEDNFEQGIIAANSGGQVLAAPDGYVQDNFEQDGQAAVQTTNIAVAANSGRLLVAPDGYVQDNFEQDGQPVVQTSNSRRVAVADGNADATDHTESRFRDRGRSVSIGNVDQEEETRL